TVGGFIAGVDYRLTDQFAIGIMGSYAHTWTNLQPSGNIDVNTGGGGLYLTYFNKCFISTRRLTARIIVTKPAAKGCSEPPTAAPAAVSSALGQSRVMTSTLVTSQSALWPLFNILLCLLMDLMRQVRCSRYRFIQTKSLL
ncbi:MAG: autotransporter outer membrane beta-barrel domain-containing protein, partial [Verrucomicrobia bacterium]|nr:autotransporter outer membrane beta-barrel domain-containing protein [Verrucomicrobiota bacterium]